MVEDGGIVIGGTINTAEIDAGLNRIRSLLEKTSDATKPVQADLERISGGIKKAAIGFGGFAAAGLGAFGALRDQPAFAGPSARIDVATDRIKRDLASTLQPAAEKFADVVEGISAAISEDPGKTRQNINKVIASVGGATIAGTAAAIAGGPITAATIIGGALTAGVATRVQDITSGKPTDILGLTGETQRMGLGGLLGTIFQRNDRKLNMFNIWDQVFG